MKKLSLITALCIGMINTPIQAKRSKLSLLNKNIQIGLGAASAAVFLTICYGIKCYYRSHDTDSLKTPLLSAQDDAIDDFSDDAVDDFSNAIGDFSDEATRQLFEIIQNTTLTRKGSEINRLISLGANPNGKTLRDPNFLTGPPDYVTILEFAIDSNQSHETLKTLMLNHAQITNKLFLIAKNKGYEEKTLNLLQDNLVLHSAQATYSINPGGVSFIKLS